MRRQLPYFLACAIDPSNWLRIGSPSGAATGFERGHVLVLVHQEELAVAQALGLAELATSDAAIRFSISSAASSIVSSPLSTRPALKSISSCMLR